MDSLTRRLGEAEREVVARVEECERVREEYTSKLSIQHEAMDLMSDEIQSLTHSSSDAAELERMREVCVGLNEQLREVTSQLESERQITQQIMERDAEVRRHAYQLDSPFSTQTHTQYTTPV